MILIVIMLVGLLVCGCIVVVMFGVAKMEEEQESIPDSKEEYDNNEEYDYGHDVDRHFLDGEGEV